MRELGVARWGDIILGPPPPAEMARMTDAERQKHEESRAQRRHDVLFASASNRPKFEAPHRPFSSESVVPTANGSQKHDHGKGA